MKRKRNASYSFHPGLLPGRLRRRLYARIPYNRRVAGMVRKARGKGSKGAGSAAAGEVVEALVGQGYKRADAKRMVARATGSDFDSLFRSALAKKNPREIPAVTDDQLQALRKLIKRNSMAQRKRKSKKKKNSRTGVMPPGLKAYWAKKRAKKTRRRRNAKSRPFIGPDGKVWQSSGSKPKKSKKKNPRIVYRTRTRTVTKYRTRTINPKPRKTPVVNLGSGFTATQIKKVGRLVARAMGRRAKFAKP